ncbi:hypothetical protein BH10ACT1_BH10ACT1_12800 [soil metagenome]
MTAHEDGASSTADAAEPRPPPDQGDGTEHGLARFALETTSDGVYVLGLDWRFTYLNTAAGALLQRSPEALVGKTLWEALPGTLGTGIEAEFRLAVATGRSSTIETYFSSLDAWFDIRVFPNSLGMVAVFRDVSERRVREIERAQQLEAAHQHARRDGLTGLANRVRLYERLDALLFGPVSTFSVLFVAIDTVRQVKESLGHHLADALLREAAARLSALAGPTDLVVRYSSDEFVVVLTDADVRRAGSVARRVQQALAAPCDVGGIGLSLSVSIGIAAADGRRRSGTTLVDDAEAARIAAKRSGSSGIEVFAPQLRDAARQRLEIVSELGSAIDRGELELVYQPILELSTGVVDAVEALVRWNHPTQGLLMPGTFIAIAEETGAIVPLGRWALRTACEQAVAWQRDGCSLAVGVNISAEHFRHGSLVADVQAALAHSGLAADKLVLELTETAIDRNFEDTVRQLRTLRTLGVLVAIDDFGSGYSTLGRLASYPIDHLKFDASLIQGSPDERTDVVLRGIVRAVVGIADSMGVGTLGEGIETQEQLVAARELGCQRVQGFAIARPMAAALVADAVRARLGPPAAG